MDPRARGADLKASAEDGSVIITGTTRWREVLDAIPSAVHQAEGVKEIRCEVPLLAPSRLA